MTNCKRKGVFCSLVLVLFAPVSKAGVLPQNEVLLRTGQSMEVWGAEWWNRFATGTLANSEGPVFFAQASNGIDPLELEYEVAADRFILMPVGALLYFDFNAVCDINCAIADANSSIDAFQTPYATIDGEPVSDMGSYIVRPGNFEFEVDGALADQAGTFFQAVHGGYWLMLEPLGLGLHEIMFGASISLPATDVYPAFEAEYDTTLRITSVPEPAPSLLLGLGLLALALLRRNCALGKH